jgi:Na+-driven multidrug efflux pump
MDLEVLLGDPRKAVNSMFLPLFLAFAVVEVNQFVDVYWISGLGKTYAETISTSAPFYILMMCAGTGVGIGATSTIAFRLGRGDLPKASSIASNALILGLALAGVSSIVLAAILPTALGLMGASGIEAECWGYMLPFIVMSPALLSQAIIAGCLRGEGAARKSTVVQISAALSNMVLDPLLIYGLGMGISGAGLATGLASLLAAGIGLSWYIRGKTSVRIDRTAFRPDAGSAKELLGVGAPKTVQEFITGTIALLQRIFIIVAGGTSAVMIYNYPFKYTTLFGLPGKAIENSMLPVASAAYGKGDLDKMARSFRYSLSLTLGISFASLITVYILAEPLMSFLAYEETMREAMPELVSTLRITVFVIPCIATKGIASSLLQSMKKARVPMFFEMFSGAVRLTLYSLCAYGMLGIDPFQGILYCMIAVHFMNAVCLLAIAVAEMRLRLSPHVRKLRKNQYLK